MGNSITQQISKEAVIDVVPISDNHTDLSKDILKDLLDAFEIIGPVQLDTKDIELVEIQSTKISEPIPIPVPNTETQSYSNKKKKKHRKGGTRF
jgi:hypothetical protein